MLAPSPRGFFFFLGLVVPSVELGADSPGALFALSTHNSSWCSCQLGVALATPLPMSLEVSLSLSLRVCVRGSYAVNVLVDA